MVGDDVVITKVVLYKIVLHLHLLHFFTWFIKPFYIEFFWRYNHQNGSIWYCFPHIFYLFFSFSMRMVPYEIVMYFYFINLDFFPQQLYNKHLKLKFTSIYVFMQTCTLNHSMTFYGMFVSFKSSNIYY